MDVQDHDLLARFRNRRDESAFRQLVDRHIGLVFAVSQRVTGSREQAEEIAQTTFARLADKSEGITRETVLAGWLYQTARRLALSAVRSDTRRRQREQIAAAMNFNEPGSNVVAEHLESAMDQLKPEDRDVLVLRFFEDRNLRDVGSELGLSEDAARMRVNRALEKLRGIFGKLGIAGSVAWLTATLPTSASATVPIGLAASITTAVLTGTAIATTAVFTHGASTTMNILNLKTGAAILAAAAITGTSTYLVKDRVVDRLHSELQAANESRSQLAINKEQAAAAIKLRDDEIEQLKKEVADLPRLRGEVDRMHRQLAGLESVHAQNSRLREENARMKNQLRVAAEIASDKAAGAISDFPTTEVRSSMGLFTRTIEIPTEQFVASLAPEMNKVTSSVTPNELLNAMFERMGIKLVAPNYAGFDDKSGRLVICSKDRAALDFIMNQVVRRLRDSAAQK